jgi:hypothetical protein
MTTKTIEQQKQQYSRQLAVYTFRQWDAVRERQLQESRGISVEPDGRPDRENERAKSPDEGTRKLGHDEGEEDGQSHATVIVKY